jgi:protein involved in polysaccharide export with SLBB domain
VRIRTALLVAAVATLMLNGCAQPTQTFAGVDVPRLKAFSHDDPHNLSRKEQQRLADAPRFDNIGYATWDPEGEPPYRLYPGDEIEMRTPGAPENNKIVTVGPDGRGSLPLIGDVMMANRSLDDVRLDLESRYASQLRRPTVELSVKAAPIKVFVGGEVNLPNAYEMIGDGNTLNAVIQAGGFKTSADTKHVVLIRRGRDGQAMMKTVDLEQAFHHGWQPDLAPLRRGDVIYVPRSGIAKVGLFMQEYLRDALPVQFSYALGPNAYVSR